MGRKEESFSSAPKNQSIIVKQFFKFTVMVDLTTQGYANSTNSTMLLDVLRLILNSQPQHGVLTHIE